jgi:transcriptional regulator with XRE-family HTH domain
MSLAAKLKELRLKKGESLQQVADAVGVSKAHIWELEGGRSKNPGLELLRNLADHFNVTVAFFSDDAVGASDAAAIQFFREFEGRLSGKDWDALRSIADRLKGGS